MREQHEQPGLGLLGMVKARGCMGKKAFVLDCESEKVVGCMRVPTSDQNVYVNLDHVRASSYLMK